MIPALALILAVDAPAGPTRLPLNRATAAELHTLPEVSLAEGEAIVALRAQYGSLSSVEQLRVLPGMDDPTLDSLRAGTTVDVILSAKSGKSYSSPEEVLAEFDDEPTVQEVQQMAMDYTMTNSEQVARWIAASRNRVWLPQVDVDYDYGEDDSYKIIYTAGTDGSDYDYDYGNQGADWQVGVSVRWQLDELLMSSEQIRVISESQDIVKLRDKVLSDVSRSYFDRRRLQVDMLLKPVSDLKKAVEDELRLMELTADIDALTGGRFSAALKK